MFVLFPPLVAQPGQRIVRAGDPVIPHAEGEFARGMGVPHIWSGKHTGGRQARGREQASPRDIRAWHEILLSIHSLWCLFLILRNNTTPLSVWGLGSGPGVRLKRVSNS